ncbi:polymorphic toxin type 15 domain-containing protein [Lysobacter capsici]|uniref:polymorphic toxin type 15 domain-containing protein n=1 Tax=Lysobacter capsici TaxID=435897 RepID=UPI00177D3D7F|nr:polymorphic toxin type 15 domain-containing protein [Lysobacter capsici]UOF17255.1 polymorphic toxin type 15 domain-containing protein [Lysobacter capsici]
MAVARIARRADPRSDPRYKRVVSKLEADTRKLKQHPPPSRKSDESAKAAKGPANEKAAGARAKQVDKLEQSDTPKPQTASFLSMLRAEIEKVMPKTLGDTEKFMKGGSGNDIKSSLKGEVGNQKQAATGDLKQNSSAAPSEAGVAAKPVTPIPPEPAAPTPQIDAAAAMPAPKPAAEVSLEDSKTEVADAKKATKQTETRLTNANDPRFSAVMSAEKAVHKQADAGPAQYRGREAATLGKAGAQAKGVAGKGVSSLLATKGGSKAKVASKQEQQKAREELELSKFTNFVVTTFNTAKAAVDKRLETLDTTVNTMFDQGTDAALNSMKSYVEDALFKYKLERYLLMPGGSLLWIKDQILDLPPEVNRFYEAGRKLFTSAMDALAVKVANLVERELAAAKNDVALAQGKIAAAQAALSPAVRARGAQLTAEYADKFGELKSGIEDKKQQLAEGLAQKYKEAFDKADEALKAIQDANKGLVTQAKEKIAEVAKALMEFKDKLMGILRKGQDTIDLILDNPGGFLSNLIAAVKGGFAAFAGRIWDHLKKGFMKWLFGALASAGIEIPGDLSLVSILKLVLGVLGITYDRMRAKAVKLLGPTAVTVIEKLVGYLQTLIGGGPAALWEQIKGDLSNLKEMVIGAIQDWIVTTIVQKAVAKVVSMFNPAGAIIQAIMMIINVVMFVIERAAQIMEFVESVINSIHAIATGSIGGAISKVEQALGNAVPILIGFLAALIGLGGISAKIKGFITKVQAKVDQAIDKVLKKAADFVKKLFGKLTGKKEDDKRTDTEKLADLKRAVAEATTLAKDKTIAAKKLDKKLGVIKKKYRMTELTSSVKAGSGKTQTIHISAKINPGTEVDVAKPKVEMDLVTVDFKCKTGLDEKEFGDQIRGQLGELKSLDAETFLKRRSDFKNRLAEQKKAKKKSPQGRDPAGDRLAAIHREKKIQEKALQLKKDNPALDAATALAQARTWAESKAVIHKLDQIAGGSGKEIEEELGDARIDFSIGAQWRSKNRIGLIEAGAEKIPADARPDVTLNVSLTVNTKAVI